MIGPDLQAAVYAALTTAGVAGGRIYDRVPPDPTFPYVTIGDEQVIDDGGSGDGGCVGGWAATVDVHVWSRPVTGSKAEAKSLAAAVVVALGGVIDPAGFVIVSHGLDTVRTFRDPDGLTEHAVVSYTYRVSPAA